MPAKVSRRGFLKGLVFAAVIGGLGSVARLLPSRRVVRPPGALVEDAFLARCIRCGQCVESCVTGTLTFCTIEDGLAIWGTPKVDPLRAPCEAVAGRCEDYRACVEACPTSALVYVEPERVKMGSAIWIPENCIAQRGGHCLVCEEVCPVEDAITHKGKGRGRKKVPVFHSDKCVGCGRCVYACPAEPKAIYLSPEGERRVEA